MNPQLPHSAPALRQTVPPRRVSRPGMGKGSRVSAVGPFDFKKGVIPRKSQNVASLAAAMLSATELHAPSHDEATTPAEPPTPCRHPERSLGRLGEPRRSEPSPRDRRVGGGGEATSLTLRGRRRSGERCASSRPPPPPALGSAILHCVPPRLRPRGTPFRMTAGFFDGRLRRRSRQGGIMGSAVPCGRRRDGTRSKAGAAGLCRGVRGRRQSGGPITHGATTGHRDPPTPLRPPCHLRSARVDTLFVKSNANTAPAFFERRTYPATNPAPSEPNPQHP